MVLRGFEGKYTSSSESFPSELSSESVAGPSDIADCSSSISSLDSLLALTRLCKTSSKVFRFVEDIFKYFWRWCMKIPLKVVPLQPHGILLPR